MKKILVLGGTQFFGKKAVNQLIENGHDVTIATRGNKPHPFGDKVTHILLDARDGSHKGWEEVTQQKWDAVFNNVLYTKEDAALMIDKFIDLTEHFYFTSSMSVYSGDIDGYEESDFDPMNYDFDDDEIDVDYGEGKRQAETVLFTEAPFEVTAFRFPIVLDTDDYTKRLHFYIERGLNGETIYFHNPDVKVNYVKGTTAADSIVWAIENEKSGIYNISSIDAITVETLMQWIEEGIGKDLNVQYQDQFSEPSPFSTPHDQYLVSNKIHNEGFTLPKSKEWMKPLITDIKEQFQEEA